VDANAALQKQPHTGRNQTPVGLGQRESRIGRGHGVVAGRHESEPTREHLPVDVRDHECRHPTDALEHIDIDGRTSSRGASQPILEIEPATKVAVLALEHHHATLGITLGVVERREYDLELLDREAVLLGWTVEGDEVPALQNPT
jgi:hypothetical protein